MENHQMNERHALKFALLSIQHQQRVMRTLANQARKFAVDSGKNAAAEDANHYDWQRRVRLSREGRAVNLVRAFLKGVPYVRVERKLSFHTQSPQRVVQDYSPFTKTIQGLSFNGDFDAWVNAEEDAITLVE